MPRPIPLLLALLFVLGFQQEAPAPDRLSEALDRIIEGEYARSAFWGIYIQDVDSGRILYRLNEDKTLLPASNQKLLTTATALDVLGSAYRYQTTLYLNGEIEEGVLRGDLIIEGSGDPTFGSRRYRQDDPLQRWAAALAEQGVTRIEGRIIGDDDVFDEERYGEGWDVTHVATQDYAPARSGLSYHDNLINVELEATTTGRPPTVDASPPGYFTVLNQAVTGARSRGARPLLERPVGAETIRIHGTVPRAYRRTFTLPVSDPTAFTLHLFAARLLEAGIDVAAPLVDVDDLAEKPTYGAAETLFVHASPPLSEIIAIINKQSDNLYAEQVFHTFGWGGSSAGGEARVKETLARLGIPTGGLSVRDGSGLSRKDLVTPQAMGLLLTRMYAHAEGAAFRASLAEGGERGTTLRFRLQGRPVMGKTGSLEYVRALSGYVVTPDARTLAFVLLANNYTAPTYRIEQAIDLIVQTLTSTPVG